LTPIQVAKLRQVTSVYPSPDGTQVAFLRRIPRLASDAPGGAYAHLYLVGISGGEERLLIGGKKSVHGVSWSPDGRWITFIDKREDDRHEEIYALPMAGGQPFRLTATANGVRSYRWRPDGKAIAYAASDSPPALRAGAREMGFKVVVVDEVWNHTSLHLWDLEGKTSKRLTSGRTVRSYAWSPDGSRLVAGISPRPLVDDGYMFVRLHIIDPAGPAVEKLIDNPGKLGQFAWSPDGRNVAYISAADRNDPHAGMLYVVDFASRQVTSLTEGFEGMVHQIRWEDDRTLRACVSRGVHTRILTMDVAEKRWIAETPPGPAFRSFSVSADGGTLVVAGSTPSHPAEVLRLAGSWKRLTFSNPWLEDVKLGTQEVVEFRARDGLEIQGLLLYPVDYQEGRRYPLVIVVHGGPEAHFDAGWNTSYSRWGQLLCARGYFAWYPNYRASTGRGVAFAKADHGDPMGGQFRDHLDAIRYFDREGLIDPARVGIGGGSYGGYAAAWAATRHSQHFAAAVSFVPFVDTATKWYTSDIPWEFYYVHYQEKWPHEQLDFLRSRSPLTFATSCRTPLLLLGGTEDTRVHPSQPYMLYSAVKIATETPVRYIRYPGEGHGNRTNVYRHDYCVRSLRWFDHYLKPGDHRRDPPPPPDLDYGEWEATGKKKAD
jgi:dipeptidyl aminopeptidase/acylaminoacyl peptidase